MLFIKLYLIIYFLNFLIINLSTSSDEWNQSYNSNKSYKFLESSFSKNKGSYKPSKQTLCYDASSSFISPTEQSDNLSVPSITNLESISKNTWKVISLFI
uniref:Uncharacterized protein n=1 Tax=Meloidogyne enterolobii TaxID=390850 RepID=A0A6V7WW94_MELEN|nr:unnamed protein product [Meloidogyne enterolobii]